MKLTIPVGLNALLEVSGKSEELIRRLRRGYTLNKK